MSVLLSLQSFLSTQPVIDFMTNILAAICVLLVTFILSRWVKSSIARMGFKYDQLDDTLFVFLSKFSQIVVIIVGATFVLNSFGVQTTSIVALLGAAGLAVGLGPGVGAGSGDGPAGARGLWRKWIHGLKTMYKHNYNCIIVKDEKELAKILIENKDVTNIIKNAKLLLNAHTEINWENEILNL